MREILFRGKRIDNGEWVEGYLYEHEPPLQCIIPENYAPERCRWFILQTAFADWNMPRQVEFIEVDPATVGQYTGLKDKKGKRIFEGDVLLVSGTDAAFVEYDETAAMFMAVFGYADADFTSLCNQYPDVEVVGNIHDNPELMEGT